jgi:Tfp pilus assembly protein PilX
MILAIDRFNRMETALREAESQLRQLQLAAKGDTTSADSGCVMALEVPSPMG